MKRILFLMTLLIAGFSANAQEIVYDNGITIYRGDTLKIVNYEDLLERELFKDEKGIRGITITSSLDREETERYRWISVLATTEFVALEMVERKLGSDHLKMRNLSTDEIYGIEISNDVYLENYVVNLSQIAREARERYDFNLASEKAARGEWDKRINIRPYDIDSDIAVWNDNRVAMICGVEYQYADIVECYITPTEMYRVADVNHAKTAKTLKKRQAWGEFLGGELGAALGAVSAAASAFGDVVENTELVTEFIVTINTGLKYRPVIQINIGSDKAKADEVVELMNSIIASNTTISEL